MCNKLLALLAASCAAGLSGCGAEPATTAEATAALSLDTFRTADAPCYDRSVQPQTSVVDTHVHFRPFGGPAIPFEEVVQYFEQTGVLFANVYGIGQTLPAGSTCTYYLDCPGTPVTPSLKNDFVNAANYLTQAPANIHLTLSMTFPDLAAPESILPGIELLDAEYPGLFRWMGEVNLVKQALFDNGRAPVSRAAIDAWAPFMEVLRERGIPLAVHSDLGDDDNPLRYLPLMEEVLRRYPDNALVWVHMGLSRELTRMEAARHVELMTGHAGEPPEPHARHRLARARGRVLLDAGRAGGVRPVPQRARRQDSAGDRLPGIARQGPRRLPDRAGGHEPHQPLPRRRRLPQHRARAELLPAAGPGLPGAARLPVRTTARIAMKHPPDGWPQISSAVFYDDAAAAIDWLCRAFGFEVQVKVETGQGQIAHSQLVLGAGLVMVGQAGLSPARSYLRSPRALDGANTQSLFVYVDDADAHCERARAAGAVITAEPDTQDYGEGYWADRSYQARDPEGHHWWFAHRVRG